MTLDQPCRTAGRPPAPLLLKASSLDDQSLGEVTFLTLRGTLDASNAEDFCQALASHLARARATGSHAVLDMAGVFLSSAAAVRALDRVTRGQDGAGRPLLVVQPRPHVREALRLAGLPGVRLHPTVDSALDALRTETTGSDPAAVRAQAPPPPHPPAPAASGTADAELRGLRAKVRSAALIGVAQGVLMERYGLPGPETAFDLLSSASQHCNVPVRVLASAVTTTPPPAGTATAWLSRHVRPPVPAAPFLEAAGVAPAERRKVLDAALREALAVTGARAADLLFVESAHNALVLEARCNLGDVFADEFAQVSGVRAPCTLAHATGRRVSVENVETDPVFAGPRMRQVLLAEGSRALHSTPVADPGTGRSVGVLSVHWPLAGRWLTPPQEKELGLLAQDVAAWHHWYRRSVVADALDHLHRRAATHQP
jgi:anti-anti-sigma regulatory factor